MPTNRLQRGPAVSDITHQHLTLAKSQSSVMRRCHTCHVCVCVSHMCHLHGVCGYQCLVHALAVDQRSMCNSTVLNNHRYIVIPGRRSPDARPLPEDHSTASYCGLLCIMLVTLQGASQSMQKLAKIDKGPGTMTGVSFTISPRCPAPCERTSPAVFDTADISLMRSQTHNGHIQEGVARTIEYVTCRSASHAWIVQ
jgi:hypothetical protein